MRFVFALAAAVLLISCRQSVYHSFVDFDENRWPQNQELSFAFDIDKKGTYDISLNFSQVYGWPYASVPMRIKFTGQGKSPVKSLVLKLTDAQGQSLADCTGDVCDLSQPVFTRVPLGIGHYEIAVRQDFPYAYLPNAIGIGIEVTNSRQ